MSAQRLLVLGIIGLYSFAIASARDLGSNGVVTDGVVRLLDEDYKTACGPLACFAALNLAGTRVTLDSVIQELAWHPGESTQLEHIHRVLNNHPGIRCDALRTNARNLAYYLARYDCTAIVPVRSPTSDGPINHVINLVDFNENTFIGIDYPRIDVALTSSQLDEVWDGTALIIYAKRNLYLDLFLLCITGINIIIGGGFVLKAFADLRSRITKTAYSQASKGVIGRFVYDATFVVHDWVFDAEICRIRWRRLQRGLCRVIGVAGLSCVVGGCSCNERVPVAVIKGSLNVRFEAKPGGIRDEHTWMLENHGVDDLIVWVEPSCACTVANIPSRREIDHGKPPLYVKPGGRYPLCVRWTTSAKADVFKQRVIVFTNDPLKSETVLTIEGTILKPLMLIPDEPTLSFGFMVAGTKQTLSAFCYSLSREDVNIANVIKEKNSMVDVTIADASMKTKYGLRKGKSIVFTSKDSCLSGQFGEEVVFETDDISVPRFKYFVSGFVSGPVTFHPTQLNITGLERFKPVAASIIATVHDRDFSVLGATWDYGDIAISAKCLSKDSTSGIAIYKISLEFEPVVSKALINSQVRLVTNLSGTKHIMLPVTLSFK